MALTSGDVRRLTGATQRLLDSWCWTGLVVPSIVTEPRRQYAFHDVIKVRALLALRQQGVSLQTIRRCLELLDQRRESITSLRLLVVAREVFAVTSEAEVIERLRDGQLAAATVLTCENLSDGLGDAHPEPARQRLAG